MATPGDVEDVPLPTLFRRAEAALKQLQEGSARGTHAARLVEEGIACLVRAAALVQSLGVFSSNEDLDDIATCDLKYVLVPHHHAQLLSHTPAGEPASRAATLQAAGRLHASFLHSALHFGMISKEAQRCVAAALEREASLVSDNEAESAESGLPGRAVAVIPKVVDPTSLRLAKIERFKLEKSVRTRLEGLQVHCDEEDAAQHDDSTRADEGSERSAWLLRVELAALQSAEALASLRQEAEILHHAAGMSEDQRRAVRSVTAQPEMLDKLRGAADGLRCSALPGGAFGAASQRDQLRAGVFLPSYTLPSMTVEQFGELKYAEAQERQRAEAERAQQTHRAQQDARSDEEDEEELQRQRAMDDWKDANPRGWGNSKLRPCG